ncbi:MAG: 7TM diverse intracellular signaling domain-containing protein [Flavobacterium sp.]
MMFFHIHQVEVHSLLNALIFGGVFMTFVHHLVLWFFNKDRLIIHYLTFLFFLMVYLLYTSAVLDVFLGQDVGKWVSIHLYEPIQILYWMFYFNFILQSIEVNKTNDSFLKKSWKTMMIVMGSYATGYFLISFGNPPSEIIRWATFIAIRVFIFIITAITLSKCFSLRSITFQRYILWGSGIYFVFGLISFISNFWSHSDMFIYPTEWLAIGSFIDVIFFSMALSYRNRKLFEEYNLALLEEANKTIDMQKIIMDKQTQLENERSRIALDMHDDLGSGLTKISYLCQQSEVQKTNHIDKIKDVSDKLIQSMSEIIWAMKQDNDSLLELISYIKRYAYQLFEDFKIETNFNIIGDVPEMYLNGDLRRQLFLITKEAFHNICKHAQATQVSIHFEFHDDIFTLKIQDNGIGIDKNRVGSQGNGLNSMHKRALKINGNIEFSSHQGTLVALVVPLSTE